MHPEDEFEIALQHYERAVREYKLAWKRYVEDVGLLAAQHKLNEALNRICKLDSTPIEIMSQAEVNERASKAVAVVDADMYLSPDIYAHRPEYRGA